MKTRAAVAFEAKRPLEVIEFEGPKAGEVLFEIKATGICHTDVPLKQINASAVSELA